MSRYGREQASQYAHTVGYWWAVAGLDYYLKYVDNVNAVTRNDIKEYLSTYSHREAVCDGSSCLPVNAQATRPIISEHYSEGDVS